ncbi:unnamed protein product [Cylicostephanus goldi]|uniref:Integrase catalytic domain-containing protein n=1 Tax=Cylicostephanus goldi TaxID=71465 RepID=A0A3P6R947_CYLGO|nr:unnamed protein product [Cylicostephanus goldi]
MVGLNEESRNFTRFFWVKDPEGPMTPENIVTYRFRRVPFGLIASPFLLAGTIHYHLQMADTPLSQKILKNTYVDNIFYGVDTVEEGKNFYENSKQLFQKAGMNLRQFTSNSEALNQFLREKEDEKMVVQNKILGISWDTAEDTLAVRLPTTPIGANIWTKRKILKIIASTFDPMGWVSPVLFRSKIFLQSLWKEKLHWDDTLPDDMTEMWKSITAKWTIPIISIPRQLVVSEVHDSVFQLHVFTDASSMGYCAVAYLVQDGAQRSSILMSKSRLAPSKRSISIPRLELSAIALGSQLLKHIRNSYADEIDFERSVIWSDSSVALMWIKSDKRLPVFIQNRVTTIRENAPDAQLRYVPGDTNPADVGSRGASITDLKSFDLWWKGPNFLCQPEEQWPTDITDDPTEKSCHSQESEVTTSPKSNIIINAERFSSWTRLLRTMQKVLLFVTKTIKGTDKIFGDGYSLLYKSAERILFRFAQLQYPPSEETKQQLGLFYDVQEALWKSKGRILNAELPIDTILPIFLPRESYITSLFILHIHQKNNHSEVSYTLNELRRTVWIPKGRLTIKRVIYRLCFHCKRYKARPYQLPPFPVHPPQRVLRPRYPFENSGMDYAGPLPCKTWEDTTVKYWILLITCLNTRAIYVDLLLDMSTQTLFQALRRFFATTAYPRWILCDNAKSFKTINELQDCLQPNNNKDDDIIDYCAQKMIDFKFIPSFSPWQGGLYEKMVHIFKTSFKHALNNRILHIEELRTLAKETETIVNHRPLTYIVQDDRTMPLRPIDFLHPWTPLSPPRVNEKDQPFIPTTTTKEKLMEDWQFMNITLERFWKRWKSEYLTSLREQFRDRHPHPRLSTNAQPKKNDVVLIQEKSLERGQWKIGQIISSSDQYQRSAKIRLPSRHIITRPINLLHKLEVQGEQQDSSKNTTNRQETSQRRSQNRHPMITRSKTAANTVPLLLTTVLTLTLIHSSGAHPRCPVEINTPKTIIYATNCIKRGLAIARHSFHGKVKLCWFPLSCPNGAIRVEIPFQHNKGLCGPHCPCPAWATSCSFSSSPRRLASKLQNVPMQLTTYHPAHVCSFSPSSECDKERRLGKFNQIELYDGTLLVVPELHIDIKDYLDSSDYLCFDQYGRQREAVPPYTGSSYFCNENKCDDNAKLFCTFGTPSAVFTTLNGSFLVKAWGITVKDYYGYLTPSKIGKNSAYCSKGGVNLIVKTPTNATEVCIADYCHFIQNPTNSNIIFPNSLVAFAYTVSISSWAYGTLIQKEDIQCGSYPVCELIDCTVCLELLYNPDCWTKTQVAVFLSSIFALLVITYMILPALKILLFIVKLPLKIAHFIFKMICAPLSRRNNTRLPLYTGHRRKILIAILYFAASARCCSEVVSFSASEEACTQNNERETCTFNQATLVTLQPLDQETCLVMKNNKNIPVGIITIRVTGVYFKCQKRIEFHTRDHQFYVESIHRCRFAGSCQLHTCDTTKTTDKVEELSPTANSHPGYTFCAASCGCLICGCFLCMDSCLFYRYYALPQSPQVYTVFNCPVWEFTVEAKITKQQGTKTESIDVRLQPGQTYDWDSVRLSLIGTMLPQLPIFGTTFVTDGNITAVTKPAYRGQMIPHTIGQLQCTNASEAKAFRCSFPSDVCTCTPTMNHVSCSCSDGEVKKVFQTSSLPLIMKNVMIFQKENEIVAKTNMGSAVQLQIVTDNMKLASKRQNTTCIITTSDIVGCYNCLSAAYANISCQSRDGEVTAQVTCGNQHQIAVCTPTGHINKLVFVFDSSLVEENCTLACPGGSTDFLLKGRLHYVPDGPVLPEKPINIVPFESKLNFSFAADAIAFIDSSLKHFDYFFSSILSLKIIIPFLLCIVFVIVLIFSFRTMSLAILKKII